MKSAQQRFWPDAQPLVERLGREFFWRLPESAGVYQMRDAKETVLYVGKAKNLRHRLGSYRVANPERMAKRTLRLLMMVHGITWEECADEAAALNRESELLLEIKPRFNRAGVWRGPRKFLSWRANGEGLELSATDSVSADWTSAGSFGSQAAHLHRALVRLFWCRIRPEAGLAGMPTGWFQGAHGNQVIIPHADGGLIAEAAERLTQLASGNGGKFPEWLGPAGTPFEMPMREEDLELVVKYLTGRLIASESLAAGSRLSETPGRI
jgi:hypothetical protein